MTDYVTLCWSETKGEGYVRLSRDFKNENWVLRMDALNDWIHDLQKIYDAGFKEDDPIRKHCPQECKTVGNKGDI